MRRRIILTSSPHLDKMGKLAEELPKGGMCYEKQSSGSKGRTYFLK